MLNSFLILILASSFVYADTQYVELKHGKIKSFLINDGSGSLIETEQNSSKVVLGSLAKLFIYSYLADTKSSLPPYTCPGLRKEESFCCEKGESIDMETALQRSCGLYFENSRTGIKAKSWSGYWSKKSGHSWLNNFSVFGPSSEVPVSELLTAIDQLPKSLIDNTLRAVSVKGTAIQGLPSFGSYPRIKTFTWDHPLDANKFAGGFSGWLPDGTVVWLQGDGKSHEVISRVAPVLEKRWSFKNAEESECVSVHFFKNYPIREVLDTLTNEKKTTGQLNGRFKIVFKNNKSLVIDGSDELTLSSWKKSPVIIGRLNLTQYIARVVDREFKPTDKKASEALSIVARTYLFQNAKRKTACYEAPDSSAFQRVSASKPSSQALAIARKTADLVLTQKNIRYHTSISAPGRISWSGAVSEQNKNKSFPEILHAYFPDAKIELRTTKTSSNCIELGQASSWLSRESLQWKISLQGQVGFEFPADLRVCKSTLGAAYLNKETKEIYIENFSETEDQISLAHEWLHMAFRHHPLTHDEAGIDNLARKIVFKR